MSELPSKHLKGSREEGGLKNWGRKHTSFDYYANHYTPAVRALDKNGGTGRGAATRATRASHVMSGCQCDGYAVGDRRTKTPRRCRGGKLMR